MSHDSTVFVVDPDPVARSAVREAATAMNLRCEEFSSGLPFVETLDRSRPGCAVLETRIPDIGGLQIQRRLHAQGVPLPVIFTSGAATVAMAVRATRDGALHFLEKPLREHELWDAIQEAVQFDGERREADRETQELRDRMVSLSPQENRLVLLLLEGKTTRQMAQELGVGERTVQLYRSEIMRKLRVKTLVGLLQALIITRDGLGIPGLPSHLWATAAWSSRAIFSAGPRWDLRAANHAPQPGVNLGLPD